MAIKNSIQFLGAAGTVTGSQYLVTAGRSKVIVDLGLFQGPRELRARNWIKPAFDLNTIEATLLTHAHIDHSGLLPRFYRQGLRSPVFCSAPTRDLLEVLLPDSGHLQEEEASYRGRTGRSRHAEPQPLYTEQDAIESLKLLKSVKTGVEVAVSAHGELRATWNPAGHILGACSINLRTDNSSVTFSGDIGRYDVPILNDPEPVTLGDLLIIESTYGDRVHPAIEPKEGLAEVINDAHARGGVLVVPSFAVGRTQLLLYYIRELKAEGRIPNVPVVVDSPMASDATAIYRGHPGWYDQQALAAMADKGNPFKFDKLFFTQSREESMKLNSIAQPMIIISASGMLTGGRILHHLKNRVSDPRNTVLFVGFQPPGSRGAWLKSKPSSMRLLGEEVPVRAEVREIPGLSAHADRNELLRWCKECKGTPKKVMVVHGEPEAADSLSKLLRSELGWDATPAQHGQELEI